MERKTRSKFDSALSEQDFIETARHLGRGASPAAVEAAVKQPAWHKPVEDKEATPKQREADEGRSYSSLIVQR